MNIRREPLVSVVVPFYNTAEYLAQCIESVLAQTYSNWELTLVNNRSTDGSREIAAEFAEKDSRINLLDNETFLSQIQNYNRALGSISEHSQYAKLLEADNWLYADNLEKATALMESTPTVGIVSSYDITEDSVRFTGLETDQTVVSGREAGRLQLLGKGYLFGAATTVMFRSSIVRSRQPFYEEIYAEDLTACYEILKDSDFGFVHDILSFTRTYNDSILASVRKLAREGGFKGSTIDHFVMTYRHGHDFLSEAEHRRMLRLSRRKVYRQMARGVLTRKSSDFWQIHRSALKGAGLRIEKPRLAFQLVLEIIRLITNPGFAVYSLARAVFRRRKNAR